MKIRKNKGFTIVELVIVIGVIGILSAILIPTFVSLTAQAKTVKEQSDAANVYSMYAAEAADGYIDAEPTVQIHLKGQQEVLITKVGSGANRYFTFDGKNWKGADAAPAVATIVSTATSWENVAYTLDGETEIGNVAGSKFNVVSDSEYFLVQYAK